MKLFLTTICLLFITYLAQAQTKVLSTTGKVTPVLVPSDTTKFLRTTGDQTAKGTKTFDSLKVNGNLSLSSLLKLGSSADPGIDGQVLSSAGPNNPPFWSDALNNKLEKSYFDNNAVTLNGSQYIPGLKFTDEFATGTLDLTFKLKVGSSANVGTSGQILTSGGNLFPVYWADNPIASKLNTSDFNTKAVTLLGKQTITGTKSMDTLNVNTANIKNLSVNNYSADNFVINKNLVLDNMRFGTSVTNNTDFPNVFFSDSKPLVDSTTAPGNMAFGPGTLFKMNRNAGFNIAIGINALYSNTSGSYNCGLGFGALYNNTTGYGNFANGWLALLNLTTGNNNLAIGTNSMSGLLNGSANLAIGNSQEVGSIAGGVKYSLVNQKMNIMGAIFGTSLTGSWDNPSGLIGILKNNPAYTLDVNGTMNATTVRANGTSISSDARLKSNIKPISNALQKLILLRPVEYRKKMSLKDKSYPIHEYGLIAQEVKKVLPLLVNEGKDEDKILSLNYTALIPLLINAIQDQQKTIETQQKDLDRLKSLEKRIQLLEQKR